MQPDDFQRQHSVSHETMERLKLYHKLLLKWQPAINLVGSKTLQNAWERHFSDSAQLCQYIPDTTKNITDLGSGAGFAGLVLGIVRPDISVSLVESDQRKAQFLRTVSRETAAENITVLNERIEDLKLSPDLVTARALASLDKLFDLCLPSVQTNCDLQFLFLKGAGVDEEVKVARLRYDFDVNAYQSITASDSKVLFISNLKPL